MCAGAAGGVEGPAGGGALQARARGARAAVPPPPPSTLHPHRPTTPGRDLYHALDVPAAGRQQQRLFSWHRRGRKVALDVAKALNYLHSKDIVHLDM